MKLPRISVGVIMAALFVVAIDCVIYRSFAERPEAASRGIEDLVCSTVPMANLLALGIAALVGSRTARTPARVGLVAGACLALIATIPGLMPVLDWIESALTSVSFPQWLGISSIAYGIFVVGLPFLFQVVAGLVGACVGREIARLRRSEPAEIALSSRPRLASLLTLLILAGLPAVLVEGYLRLNVDPRFVRFAQGQEAVVDLESEQAMPVLIPASSPIHPLADRKVRVESDREPFLVEYFCDSFNGVDGPVNSRDQRGIKVTILDGPKAGELATLPHYLLQPLDQGTGEASEPNGLRSSKGGLP